MAHDIDPHEGRELGARVVASRRHRLLADPLQLGLRRGDDVVQQLVLRLEVIVERALRQAAGLHDVAHRHHRIAALGELGEGGGTDRLDRLARFALGGRTSVALDGWRGDGASRRLALAHRAAPAMPSTRRQPSSAAGRTSLPDSAARTFDAVPSSARA